MGAGDRVGGELDGNFKEPFRGSRVFEIFPLKELQAWIDSSVDPLGGQQRQIRQELRTGEAGRYILAYQNSFEIPGPPPLSRGPCTLYPSSL